MKKELLIYASLLTAGVLGGYFLSPTKTIEKIVKVESTKTKVDTVKIREKKPDGSVITRIETKDRSETLSKEDSSKITDRASGVNLNALVGYSFQDLSKPVFGASISKQFAGPFSLGIWGMSNGTGGLSIGIKL